MAQLSRKLLKSFQKTYKERYEMDISLEEADAELRSLMGLIEIVFSRVILANADTNEEQKGVSNEQ